MIPDKAVEAAWVAFYHGGNDMHAAIEAALPYLTEPTHQPVTDWPDIPRGHK